jgi:hypothetical protein
MHRSANVFAGEGSAHALDLPPMAETKQVSVVAAAFGASGSFEAGIVSEAVNEIRCLRKRGAACDERRFHASS